MITIDILVAQIAGLDRQDVERWVLNQWVRPEQQSAGFVFAEIDVARVKLIQDLRHDLDIDEEALPIILSLMDQLYELRRRFNALGAAIAETAPKDVQRKLAAHLVMRASGGLD